MNDIQPALTSTEFWEKGDLFLSLRHKSCIVQFRPSEDRVIRLIQGGFINQHDVDILDSPRIAVIDNNSPSIGFYEAFNFDLNGNGKKPPIETGYSRILVYDLEYDSTYSYLESQFSAQSIYSETEGLFEILSNGLTLVESQNEGKVYVFDESQVVLKKGLPHRL